MQMLIYPDKIELDGSDEMRSLLYILLYKIPSKIPEKNVGKLRGINNKVKLFTQHQL